MISEVMKAKLFAKIRLILETEFGRDSLMSLRFCFVAITTQSFWVMVVSTICEFAFMISQRYFTWHWRPN